MRITLLTPGEGRLIRQAAALLVEGFKVHWPDAWPDLESALAEVRESLKPDRISLMALDAEGAALGWVGGIPQYGGRVWELHPLVVHPQHRGRGVGRGLVQGLEREVEARGGITLLLGTDDEDGMTTLSGVDLYSETWKHLRHVKNLAGHPYSFYEKLGFAIVGVIPDANGPGKPDILMAKRVARK